MSKKKSDLKSDAKELRARLAKAEARAERWKARAKQAEADHAAASETGNPAPGTLPEQRIGQAVSETLRVLTTTLDDVVTNARAAFEELAAGKRADAPDASTPAPPTTRPAWPPTTSRTSGQSSQSESPDPSADEAVYDDPRSS